MHDFATAAAPRDHLVQFYESEGFLGTAVANFLAEGLRAGEAVIAIATPAHRELFSESLTRRGIAVARELDRGTLVMLDASELLATFLVSGVPVRERFQHAIGGLLARVARTGSGVRAYGEMVDLLWRAGQRDAALQLEELWNELHERHDFTLLCAYVLDSFYRENGLPEICGLHSHVAGPEPSATGLTENVHALVAEIARRTELEATLRASVLQLREAEDAARRSKEDLEDFLDNAVVPIHRVDKDGVIRWANAAELALLGYTADEYLGRHVADFHVDAAAIADILARLGRGETLRDHEACLRAKDGSVRHVQLSSNAQRRDGELVTTRCFSRDVTALEHAEEDREAVDRVGKLLTAELELDKVVEHLIGAAIQLCRAQHGAFVFDGRIGDGVVRVDDVARDPHWHGTPGMPAGIRSFLAVPIALASGELVGVLYLGHAAPAMFGDRDERLVAAIATQAAAAIGNARLYEAERKARTSAESAERRTALLHGMTLALSRALTAEEAARVVIHEARRLIAAPAGAVMLLDAGGTAIQKLIVDGQHTEATAARLQELALSADVPLCEAARTGKLVWVAGHDAIVSRYPQLAELRADLQTWGAVPIVFEGRTLGAIGLRCDHERPLSADEEAMLLAVGRQCGQAIERARLHDATLAARAEAEQANRAKDEFLAMLGHELRNPLSPILTAVQLMRLRGEGSSAREQNIIERQVNHLIHLVDDLLDISRITRGKVQLEKRPLKLAGLVTKAIEIAGPLCEERRHNVTVVMPDEDIWLEGDETRLCQVLSNLLTNAAKYTPSGGAIDVRVAREAGEVHVHVKDTGIGIAADLLPHIFDLFVQGHRASDRKQGGLGIGLALVRNLVAMHNGRVTAASDGIGRGSDFVVTLPVIELRTPRPPDEGERRLRHRLAMTPRRILVVDDNEDAGMLLGEMLRSVGHEVTVALDGPRALEAIKRFTPEVAILDIGLPVMDGYELGAALRERLGPGLRLMAVTGYGQEQDRARTRDAGFEMHFVKPVGLNKVLAAIEVVK